MLIKLAAAQYELEAAGAELRQSGNASAIAANEAGRADLAALQRSVATASPAALPALRAEIATAVAAITATAQQARATASASSAETARTLAEAASASRAAVTTVMNGMGDLKLTFASPADEEGYRQREADRRTYIQAQEARHTSEGDLNAAGGAVSQMVDAKAHGAGNDARYEQRWTALVETTATLRAEVVRNGGSTKEFDDRLRTDLRAILKAKGLSDAQIDGQFAAHSDPLEAAKAYVSDHDVEAISRAAPTAATVTAPAKSVPVVTSAEDAMAKFRAAGVVPATHSAGDEFVHGIARSEGAAQPSRVI